VTSLVAMTSNAPTHLLTELYVAHYTGPVRLAALLLDERAAREDVVQEAYIRAAATEDRPRDPDASLAYLRRTVVDLSRSAMRRRLVATRYLSRDLPESTVSDGSPSSRRQVPTSRTLSGSPNCPKMATRVKQNCLEGASSICTSQS
jgi:DNA-directed RNA polymerase specialized sigma24 family protein